MRRVHTAESAEATVEQVRMCLAEAGYPDVDVFVKDVDGEWTFYCSTERNPPVDVVWRARELTQLDRPVCLECFKLVWGRWWNHIGCEATQWMMLECGA